MKSKRLHVFAMTVVLGVGLFCAGISMGGPLSAPERAYAVPDELAAAQADGAMGEGLSVTAAAVAKPSKAQLKAFKKASADFSLELFGRCVDAKGKNANVTIAPMSVMNALAITANGASGKTLGEMREVLGDGASLSRINKNLRWYNSKLVNKKKARLNTANSIWYSNDGLLKMKKKFLSTSKKYYNAEVNAADFSDAMTVSNINSWVAEKTNNMIKRVIDQLQVEDRTVIVNALYFDAEWLSPYDKSDVFDGTFTNAKGKKRTIKMMSGTEYSYIEGKNVTGFIKPYAKGYSYVALLPTEGMSLKKFVKTLDGDAFRKLVSKASRATVRTVLPKYSLSYTNESMVQQLADMGIKRAFAPNANFKNMGTDAMGNLFVGDVIHKTKIDLDERGTKAAAVTAVVAKASSALVDVKRVVLDRPFVYAIIDNTTKLPVFIGTVNNITSQPKEAAANLRTASDSNPLLDYAQQMMEAARSAQTGDLKGQIEQAIENGTANELVSNLISSIPTTSSTSLEDAARMAVLKATVEQLAQDQIAKLSPDVLDQLEEGASKMAAEVVSTAIDALPEAKAVTVKDKMAIEATKAAYDALPSEQQTLVSNVARLKAAVKRVNAIADLANAKVSKVKTRTYSGKEQVQSPVVKDAAGTLLEEGIDYVLSYESNVDAGTAYVVVTGRGSYEGAARAAFKIKKAANKVTVKKRTVSKSLSAKSLKKKAATIALPKVRASFGAAKWSVRVKDGKGALKLSGQKLTVKKAAAKGKYCIKLKAAVKKSANYKAAESATVTVTVRVK